MKDIEKIIENLKQAQVLIEQNIDKAENVDLVDMNDNIEYYISVLVEIGDFETYED
jgi:hypothetical protein